MASFTPKSGFPEFFADARSAESVRRQLLEAPLEGVQQSALGPALELAKLLSLLPDAFAASQRRELERIQDSAEENDPRVAALEASIEQAEALRTMARRGKVRAQRSLVALASKSEIFHGFVSDSDLNPVPDLTVRLAGDRPASARELSGTTDADGYFSIALGKASYSYRKAEKEAANLTPERIAELFAEREKESAATGQLDEKSEGSRVEILKKGKLVHEDPVPIALDDGSVYREYVISDQEPASPSDFRAFMSQRQFETQASRVDPQKGAAKASSESTAGSASSPSIAIRSAKKKSTRAAKSTKRTSKK